MMANRRESRELLMRLVYQMSVTGDWSDEEKAGFLAENPYGGGDGPEAGNAYFDAVLAAVKDNLKDIDDAIERSSDNWKIGRIAKVDLAIIRLAAAEMAYIPDIPTAVSVNEAVDLAKRYGSDRSYEFVNGVLGRLARGGAAVVDKGGSD
ncbi:MAG: transcription antitermination factor NusB [Clostridiales Family XIII bacterium]|jgi:N utilization substance protein B|nr:transcription antitermination factor NusB [Clostridiales Family XIII bacterium]